ncbi:hypothetical protein [Flavobacterium cerinum]|uniref:Lipoprotein n=1 Tax=Flavobacterium cerinum TaxID=2502784 RepID=A0ABY5IPD3_9FLAO|nr:hypothetical protein [Flavobacterium cerinum]UUC44619.1 hypothetical protein NOX80_13380 [Flavobacterium cerinum]
MKNRIFILLLIILCFSCSKSTKSIIWYDKIVVNAINKDEENAENYRIALGISAQVFYLSSKTENFPQLLNKLSKSYREQKPVKIGIENGTNQIREVIMIIKK